MEANMAEQSETLALLRLVLGREGTAAGVLADSLLRAATSAFYRKHLTAANLVFVSPLNPEAGFNVGNAMGRNPARRRPRPKRSESFGR